MTVNYVPQFVSPVIDGSPSTTKPIINLGVSGLRARLRDLAVKAEFNNAVDAAVASGVTMTAPGSADAALTNQYVPVSSGAFTTEAECFQFTGGTATPFPAQNWVLFPVSSVAPAVNGSLVGYLPATPSLSAFDWQVSFMTDALVLEIQFLAGTNINFRMLVDDRFVAKSGTAPAGTGTQYARLDFGSTKAVRHITFCGRGTMGFGRVNVGATESVWAPPTSAPKIAVTGDSYSEGQGLASPVDPFASWPTVFGRLMGWHDVRQVAVGGTGYVNNATTRSAIAEQVANWGFTPDVVIAAGGYNDNSSSTALIESRALAAFTKFRQAAPSAPIFVLGPWTVLFNNNATMIGVENAIGRAFDTFNDDNSYFIRQVNIASPWLFGTGRVGATNGSGNTDFYISTDTVHPGDAGHLYLARRAAASIRSIVAGWSS